MSETKKKTRTNDVPNYLAQPTIIFDVGDDPDVLHRALSEIVVIATCHRKNNPKTRARVSFTFDVFTAGQPDGEPEYQVSQTVDLDEMAAAINTSDEVNEALGRYLSVGRRFKKDYPKQNVMVTRDFQHDETGYEIDDV